MTTLSPLRTAAGVAGIAPVINPRVLSLDDSQCSQAVLTLAAQLAATAVQRDQQGGSAQAEKQLFRQSGLLHLSIPRKFGGQGSRWPEIYRITRYLAAVDSSLAHLFAFHHLQLATIQLFGSEQQQKHWLTHTIERDWFWGNATNGRDTGLQLVREEDHYLLLGSKSFCSGALGADALVVSAPVEFGSQERVFLALPASRDGLLIDDDWDGFGQRQTDSGTVHFEGVYVDPGDLLEQGLGTPRATLRTCVSQMVLVQIYLGNAAGALSAAVDYIHERARSWPGSTAEKPTNDALIQLRLGQLWSRFDAASALAERAAERLQQLLDRPQPTPAERGELATWIAEAKLLSGRVALDITSEIFETMGARATSSRFGFDRFWRNVRVHTLHDPLDHKQKDIGRWLLTGEYPPPSNYS